jgi:hypothetical protein
MRHASLPRFWEGLDGAELIRNSLGRRCDPEQGRGDMDRYLFQLVGNKPRWIRFAHVYDPAERIACGTTVNSITAPNDKNRDHGQEK